MRRIILLPLCTFFLAAATLGCADEEAPVVDELEEGVGVGVPDAAPVEPVEAPGAGQEGAVLAIDTLEGVGPYLTDRDGRALYLLVADTAGMSTCYDACAEVWPPFLAEGGAATAGAPPVQASLIGTIDRRAGDTQVTYNGHPLYYYVEDLGPGEATGQDYTDQWGEWYLVHPEGHELEQ